MTFYRYIRPVKFDAKRHALVTLPRGGVCLRFDENADGTLNFVYAYCPDSELFSKEVAKRMVDWRSTTSTFKAALPKTKSTDKLIENVLTWSTVWQPPDGEMSSYYTVYDLRNFAEALASLALKNDTEKMKMQLAKDCIEALDTKGFYDHNAR